VEVGALYQKACVDSWRRAGFDIVSLNCAREIHELEALGYELRYQEVTGERPTIADLLSAIRASARPVAGIINADVLLVNQPTVLDAVMDRAVGGIVIAERMNIDPTGRRLTWQTCHGFDAFFFSTDPLSRIDTKCQLLLGEPWWDYCLPLAYAAAGARLMTAGVPLIYHLDHPQKWRSAQWITSGNKAIEYLLRWKQRLPDVITAEIQRCAGHPGFSEDGLVSLSHLCFAWLLKAAEMNRICTTDPDVSVSNLVALIDQPEVSRLVGALNDAQATIVNSNRIGAKALLESLCEEINGSTESDRYRVLAALHRKMQEQCMLVWRGQARSGEDLLEAIGEANLILRSRRAAVSHLLALNVAWLRKQYSALRRILRRTARRW
jgi:hypothetical protein